MELGKEEKAARRRKGERRQIGEGNEGSERRRDAATGTWFITLGQLCLVREFRASHFSAEK